MKMYSFLRILSKTNKIEIVSVGQVLHWLICCDYVVVKAFCWCNVFVCLFFKSV